MKPFTVLTGRIRTRATDGCPPVVCMRASTAKQIASAQQLWKKQFRRVGLMNEPSEEDILRTSPTTSTGAEPAESTDWTAISINAYQNQSLSADVFGRRLDGQSTRPHRRDDATCGGICGTVTLLVPKAEDMTTGRITRLAIDHPDQRLASSPLAYRRVFLEMTSYLHQVAREYQLTHLEAFVHPRHAKLYRRVFNATPIGKPFACEDVAGAPAQLMKADIQHPKTFHRRLRARYAG